MTLYFSFKQNYEHVAVWNRKPYCMLCETEMHPHCKGEAVGLWCALVTQPCLNLSKLCSRSLSFSPCEDTASGASVGAASHLYKYSYIFGASTTVIAWRHIHIYRTIWVWRSTLRYSRLSSQAKQCHMTQLRETTAILFSCLSCIWCTENQAGKGLIATI